METKSSKSGVPILLIGGLCLAGVILLASSIFADGRRTWHSEGELEVIQAHLPVLKALLKDYADQTGHYPTTNEGLSPLISLFDTQITITHIGRWEMPYEQQRGWWAPSRQLGRGALGFQRGIILQQIVHPEDRLAILSAKEMSDFRPLPSSDDGGEITVVWREHGDELEYLLVADDAGIYSPSLLPFMYENRRGLRPELFGDSPANEDANRRFSIEVDDGIYVYSLLGRELIAELRAAQLWAWGLASAGVACLLGALVLVFWPRPGKAGRLGMWLAVVVGSIVFGTAGRTTCYIMAPLFYRRRPEIIAQQRKLLDEYHERGVINDETYARLVRGTEGGPGQPATTEEATNSE
jgi:hypothetical protein